MRLTATGVPPRPGGVNSGDIYQTTSRPGHFIRPKTGGMVPAWMPHPIQEDFRRYAALIEALLPPSPAPETFAAESDSAVQVERGAVYAAGLRGTADNITMAAAERIVTLTHPGAAGLHRLAVVDRQGHHRPLYRPLLVYGWLQAFRLLYEVLPRMDFSRWEEALRAWCDLLEAELTGMRWADGEVPGARGAFVGEAAWTALALFAAGKVFVRDAWTDLASDAIGRVARAQRPEGNFLTASGSDNPETLWYHELALLHAAASYAVQAEDRTVAAAVARATEYHLRETQPDHATAQPWAVFAYAWNADTRPLADQVLHAVRVQHPTGATGVSLILLADALYCLRLFERPQP